VSIPFEKSSVPHANAENGSGGNFDLETSTMLQGAVGIAEHQQNDGGDGDKGD